MNLALLTPDQLHDWRDYVKGGGTYEWRAYEAGAIVTNSTTNHIGTVNQRELVGWRSSSHGTPESALQACRQHGSGDYLIALFVLRPFGTGWSGKLAAVFTVNAVQPALPEQPPFLP